MQIKRINNSDTNVTLTITLNEKDMKEAKESALGKLASSVSVSGFRKGKAPLHVVEKHVDQAALQSEVVDAAMQASYSIALKQESISPIGKPSVTLKKFVPFTELEYEAVTDKIGDITLPDYSKIKKKAEKVEVTPKDVQAVLDNLQEKAATKKEVTRGAKNGDEVTINFTGKDAKDNPIKGADGKDYPLTLGSNAFIPGFEDNVIGLKKNESKTFTLTFPKDYGVKSIAGKKVTFTVEVTKVHELEKPKLDYSFAAKVGPFTALADLKKDIKKQLTVEKQTQATRKLESDVIQEIVSKSKLALPESLLEEQIERLKNEVRQNLMYRGQTWQEMLEAEDLSEEEFIKAKLRPEAEHRVKTGLVLSEIASKEDISVTADEISKRIQLLKGQYSDKAMQAELDKPEAQQEIGSRIMTEKTVDRLVQSATKGS